MKLPSQDADRASCGVGPNKWQESKITNKSEPEHSDAGVGIGMPVGPSEECSECWLELAEGFGTSIG